MKITLKSLRNMLQHLSSELTEVPWAVLEVPSWDRTPLSTTIRQTAHQLQQLDHQLSHHDNKKEVIAHLLEPLRRYRLLLLANDPGFEGLATWCRALRCGWRKQEMMNPGHWNSWRRRKAAFVVVDHLLVMLNEVNVVLGAGGLPGDESH